MGKQAEHDDTKLLAALALALVDQPRGTLQELAKTVGISKATLYRFCRTREQLIERLGHHSMRALKDALDNAGLEDLAPLEALKRLIANNLEHRELQAFLMYYWKETGGSEAQMHWDRVLDTFFLRGQQQGVFRIDISAAALTEIFSWTLVGLINAERLGKVARLGLATLVENSFLQGAMATKQPTD
ncbi:TetR/AcrR family transcriptional regulator [Achromobacter insolitus]|uniref:Uncharacterized protein n=1 Tax=Achromobacter insolitus TaxID=217204 RepID=A0A6S7F8N6_9BURK|nr:TetR/AcrR family transcriptional regulator [Achromobacter insolitus]CAB3937988.1 hypothetical protein LMG6000_05614 [Achromobacter insolitus]CAB3939093.1 hypothetical protein LMG5997_03942 [Achromobacter insolitus]